MNYQRLDKFIDRLNIALSRTLKNRYLKLSFVEGESVFELVLANKGTKVQDRGSDYSFIFYIEDGLITLKKLSFDVDYRFQDVSFQSDFELEAKLLGIIYSIVVVYEDSSVYDFLSIFTDSTIENPQDWFSMLLGVNTIPFVLKGLNEFDFENHTIYVSENSASLISNDGRNDNFTISSEEDVIYVLVYLIEYLCGIFDIENPKLWDKDISTVMPEEEQKPEEEGATSGDELNPEDDFSREGEEKTAMQGEGGEAQSPNTPTEAGPGLQERTVAQP